MHLVCRLLLEKNFFNDTATTEIYTLSLHDALPILQTALDRHYGKTEPLVPLNDTLELNAHNYMEQRLSK